MEKSLSAKIKSLKEELSNLSTTNQGKNTPKERLDNKEILKLRMQELKEAQKNKAIINVGGKEFFYLRNELQHTIFPYMLEEAKSDSIFFDSSPENFTYIDTIIHLTKSDTEKETEITVKRQHDIEILREIISEVFPSQMKVALKYEEIKEVKKTPALKPEAQASDSVSYSNSYEGSMSPYGSVLPSPNQSINSDIYS